jgi:hypothetical protein
VDGFQEVSELAVELRERVVAQASLSPQDLRKQNAAWRVYVPSPGDRSRGGQSSDIYREVLMFVCRSSRFAALTAGAFLLATSASFAEMVKMSATLDGAQESPPVTTEAKGTADVAFDTDTKMLTWTVEYSGLSGDATAGHFHGPADKGANAGVAVPFEGPVTSPIKGSATLTDAQAADLMAGKYYINIHTAANKDGEIRGQVEKAM